MVSEIRRKRRERQAKHIVSDKVSKVFPDGHVEVIDNPLLPPVDDKDASPQ